MYHKFNAIMQRLTGATSSAYVPHGLKPTVPAEAPPTIFASPTRMASEAKGQGEYMGRNKVPELQKLFQRHDGVPIYLKRGLIDRMLYRTTMGLTIGGTLYCMMALFMYAQPK